LSKTVVHVKYVHIFLGLAESHFCCKEVTKIFSYCECRCAWMFCRADDTSLCEPVTVASTADIVQTSHMWEYSPRCCLCAKS